jgi:malate dehydrogenase (oxaloacetate-decarboxylating)(NADP+)
MDDDLRRSALEYHKLSSPGKLTIVPTKPMNTQRDLALAYSPGVAVPCLEIEQDPSKAFDYTARGNLVAVISNGTAVLGLGNIGALASKPVMEGKAVLFKKFAGIDSIDIEVDETDIDKIVDIVASLEPTFGGINLEDIKAPECFEIERRLKERMKIPVFHDDQHGTAIIVAAAVINWAKITNRKLEDVKVATSGAGASAMACMNMLVSVGITPENILVNDRDGIIHTGRDNLDEYKQRYARDTDKRTLKEALDGADLFLGLSAAGALKQDMITDMNKDPLILALANPTPEIMPELVQEVRPDAMIATGRSDYPNQVNNVLCFPFIFRGALDVGASQINEDMKRAAAHAIAELARLEANDLVSEAYGNSSLIFGPDYFIPKAFDPRLMVVVSMGVAKAAMESGVATRPITDWAAYEERLNSFSNRTHLIMRPVYELAKKQTRKVVYAEGEEQQVLRAIKVLVNEKIAHPVLVGRRNVVDLRMRRLGLNLTEGVDFTLVDPESDPRYNSYSEAYYKMMQRNGVTMIEARTLMRTNNTVIASMLLEQGEGDAMICGVGGKYHANLDHILDIVGLRENVNTAAAMVMLMLPKGNFFICDTHVNEDPTAEEIAEITLLAAEQVRRLGIDPKVALLSHSNFGSHSYHESAFKMRQALEILRRIAPELEVEGEMQGDSAINPDIRERIFPDSVLTGQANLLVMPNLDSANISFNLLNILSSNSTFVGPLLLGVKKPVHIVTPSVRSRGIVDITAHAVATLEAQREGDTLYEDDIPQFGA